MRAAEHIFTTSRRNPDTINELKAEHATKRSPDLAHHADEAEEDKSVDAWLQDVMKMQQDDPCAELWGRREEAQHSNVATKPQLAKSHTEQTERVEDPRVSAMAKLYERQMKAKVERERQMGIEKEKRLTSDIAVCTFSPRINESSRYILAGCSAPGWAASKLDKKNGTGGHALLQALGWDEPLMRSEQGRKTPTKSSPPDAKIATIGSHTTDRVNDFGERLYEQAMKLKELKKERARLQDQEDHQLRHFLARRYRSTSPSYRDRGSEVSPSQDNMWPDKSPTLIFNKRTWLNRDLLQPSDYPSQSLDWPEFVERQESFIRNREEKLRIEREQHLKQKPTPMSPGSRHILNGLRGRSSLHHKNENDINEVTFNQWILVGARSRSLPRSNSNDGKASSLSSRQPSSVSRILRPMARNRVHHDQNKVELASLDGKRGPQYKGITDTEPPLFKPAITARAARRRPSSITELHDGGRSRREAWRQDQRLLRVNEEAQELTLRPSISPSSYHKTSLIRRDPDAFVTMWRAKQAVLEEKRKQAIQEKEEAELKECTFKPSVNQTLPLFVLTKPNRLLAEHSHYDSRHNGSSLVLSLESEMSSSAVSRRFSHSVLPVYDDHELESMNHDQLQDKEGTLQKALELLNDVDAFLAKD